MKNSTAFVIIYNGGGRMYCMYYFNNSSNIIISIICIVLILIINFIKDLIDFKRFARYYYDLDIHIFRFTLSLLKSKIKNDD